MQNFWLVGMCQPTDGRRSKRKRISVMHPCSLLHCIWPALVIMSNRNERQSGMNLGSERGDKIVRGFVFERTMWTLGIIVQAPIFNHNLSIQQGWEPFTFGWVGDKVQVSETDDEGYPHIITDIVATSSNRTDCEELPAIQERLEKRKCKPAEHYVDAGYISDPNLSSSRKNNIDLIGPLASFVTPQDRLANGITQSHFQVDAIHNIVICPKGHVATNPSPVNTSLSFRFPLKTCIALRCCTGKGGRTIGISAYYEFTEAARARQKTEAFKKDYYQHRSGVEGSLSAFLQVAPLTWNGHQPGSLDIVPKPNTNRVGLWHAPKPWHRFLLWPLILFPVCQQYLWESHGLSGWERSKVVDSPTD